MEIGYIGQTKWGIDTNPLRKLCPCRRLSRCRIQSHRDRIGMRLCRLALSAEMTTPTASDKECDTPAGYGSFTGLFTCLFARDSPRRRAQVLFARARVAYSVGRSTHPCKFPPCRCYERWRLNFREI